MLLEGARGVAQGIARFVLATVSHAAASLTDNQATQTKRSINVHWKESVPRLGVVGAGHHRADHRPQSRAESLRTLLRTTFSPTQVISEHLR